MRLSDLLVHFSEEKSFSREEVNTLTTNINQQKKLGKLLSFERKRIAESPSPCPDSSYKVYHPIGALRNIAAYGALLLHQKEAYWFTDKEVNYFRSLCYRFNYNGKWKSFQEILETTLNFEEFESKTIEIFGSHTYWGNIVGLILMYSRTINHEKTKNSKVRKPQRKRGYDDHGSLRPFHQRGRNLPDVSPREDRRGKVKHPILSENRFFGDVGDPKDHVSQTLFQKEVTEPWYF